MKTRSWLIILVAGLALGALLKRFKRYVRGPRSCRVFDAGYLSITPDAQDYARCLHPKHLLRVELINSSLVHVTCTCPK